MFLQIGNQIINRNHIVSAKYEPGNTWTDDEQEPPRQITSPSSLCLTMTSTSGQEVTNYDGDVIAAYSESDVIMLTGQMADDTWAYLSEFFVADVGGFSGAIKKAQAKS